MTPAIPLHDPRFQYIPASKTDVQRTWRKYGWVPPTEANPEHYRQQTKELNGVTY